MTCNIWLDNDAAGIVARIKLYTGSNSRGGQKITIPSKTICKVRFAMSKSGSPTGTAYAKIRKVSDDSIIETSATTLDVSTLPTYPTFSWEEFLFNSVINEDVRLLIEYSGGNSTNYIVVLLGEPTIDGMATYYVASYTDNSSYDCKIGIYILGGVAHYQTCSEILGLVDGKSTKTAFHKTTSEVLGLVDDYDKNRCKKCEPSSVILTF